MNAVVVVVLGCIARELEPASKKREKLENGGTE
jgi:hypothetical protein